MQQLSFNFIYLPKSADLEGQTVNYWAKHYNVTKQRIHQRLKQFGSPHPRRKVAKVPKVKPVLMWRGYTYEQLAEMYGVSYLIVSNRIRWYGDNWARYLPKPKIVA